MATKADLCLSAIKTAIWRATRRCGIDIRRWPSEGTLERDLRRVIRACSIDTVLDVGANEGQYAEVVRRNGFRGTIISVEPNPGAFRVLQQKALHDERWRTMPCALGAVAGTAELTVYENHQLSSLHARTDWGAATWNFGSATLVPVEMKTLDIFVDEQQIEPSRALLKLDTQGHDWEVLKGGPKVCQLVGGIQLEMPIVHLYEEAPDFGSILAEVLRLGFRPLGFYVVQRDRTDGILPVEFDGLFIRSDLPAGGTFSAA